MSREFPRFAVPMWAWSAFFFQKNC